LDALDKGLDDAVVECPTVSVRQESPKMVAAIDGDSHKIVVDVVNLIKTLVMTI
jgi:hypothetical protein